MAITSATIANTLQMRAELDRYVIESEIQLLRMWSAAWVEVSDEFALAIADLVDLSDEGGWPTRTQTLRAQRTQNALKVTAERLQELIPASAVAARQNLAVILASAEHWSERITRTQLPPYGISQTWSRVDPAAMDAIIKRSTGRIHSLTQPLNREKETPIKASQNPGVPYGDNPLATARQKQRR
jgi:hypothetical protein